MDARKKKRFARVAARKTGDELVRMILHSDDWELEALEAAREELTRRKLGLPEGAGAVCPPEAAAVAPEEDESVWKVVQDGLRAAEKKRPKGKPTLAD